MKKRLAVPPYPGSEQAWGSYENWPVWLREHRVKVLSISMRSHFSIKIFEKRVAVPLYPGSEQAWGSYENWPVWLCGHRIKVLSISTRSHFSIKNCYWSLYRRTRALNSKMVVIENDQYDCATIVSNFQPILRGRTFSDEKEGGRTAVPRLWTGMG